jgi:uncharacterized protein YndB with AHSA1/START domain
MRYVMIAVAVVIAIALIVLLIGWTLPTNHTATKEATYRTTPTELFMLISDLKDLPEWRPSVKTVEALPTSGGRPQYREIGKNGSILYEIDSSVPDRLFVTRIADRSLPFGGTWTFELTPHGDSTTLRITEDGEVYNPVFRFVSRFVLGHTASIEEYLRDVGRKFGGA